MDQSGSFRLTLWLRKIYSKFREKKGHEEWAEKAACQFSPNRGREGKTEDETATQHVQQSDKFKKGGEGGGGGGGGGVLPEKNKRDYRAK